MRVRVIPGFTERPIWKGIVRIKQKLEKKQHHELHFVRSNEIHYLIHSCSIRPIFVNLGTNLKWKANIDSQNFVVSISRYNMLDINPFVRLIYSIKKFKSTISKKHNCQ